MMRFLSLFERRPLEAELLLLLLGMGLAWLIGRLAPAFVRGLARRFSAVASHRAASVLLIALLTILLQAGATLLIGVPAPTVHDEFCYLLAADTFVEGRLANPPHPLWEHFESFHLIHQPAYAAKYPPMQGLFLALGQLLGHPLMGVWLSLAAANGAVCWMLQQWLPARWALLGGLLLAVHPRIFWAWGQTYMGGAAAMLGGALLFGAARRLADKANATTALVLGLGLAILANSRPFEGFVISVPVALLVFSWWLRPALKPLSPLGERGWREGVLPTSTPRTSSPPSPLPQGGEGGTCSRGFFRRVVVPLSVLLALVGAAMGYYHWRVTGDPLRMPYQVHEETYSMTPVFLWQELRPMPSYRHAVLREFHAGWALRAYHARRSFEGFAWECWLRLKAGWQFFLGPVLTVPLLAVPWVLKRRWMRFAFGSCLLLILGLALGMWFGTHYAAPMMGLLLVLALEGFRIGSARLLPRLLGRRPGRQLAQSWMLGTLLTWLVLSGLSFPARIRQEGYTWPRHRAELQERLEADGAEHLILVRYGPRHSPHCEWVYNRADMDSAKVVWAREMASNIRLLDYFLGRRVWLLEVEEDDKPPRLSER